MSVSRLASSLASALLPRHASPEMQRYATFEEALRDSDSYEDPRVIEVVSRKTQQYQTELKSQSPRKITSRQAAQNAFVFSWVEPDRPLEVLEIGGACGASYFETKHLLPQRIARWSISETPAMAAAGEALTAEPDLSFHVDLESGAARLGRRDLAIAQGVLQYASAPLNMLSDLLRLGFSYLYVTRTVVAVGADAAIDQPIFTKQETEISAHGPGKLTGTAVNGKSSQPLTIVGLESILKTLSGEADPIYWFDEGADRVLLIGGQVVTVRDIGFLVKIR